MSEDEVIFVTTIYGEANLSSEVTWQAIACLIMNRIGVKEWAEYATPIEVIKYSGFDAYSYPNQPFKEAKVYFENRDYTNEKIERMIELVIPIYRGEVDDITGGAVLYYSPNAQKALHEEHPQKYPEKPTWDFSKIEEVEIEGTENDDFKFYRYK